MEYKTINYLFLILFRFSKHSLSSLSSSSTVSLCSIPRRKISSTGRKISSISGGRVLSLPSYTFRSEHFYFRFYPSVWSLKRLDLSFELFFSLFSSLHKNVATLVVFGDSILICEVKDRDLGFVSWIWLSFVIVFSISRSSC